MIPELKLIRMSDIESAPVEWLWEPYIPRGAVSLIQGDGGEGKTTVSLAIAAAITRGESLPGGGGNAAPSSVILQNAEDSYPKTIKLRFEKLGADCDKIVVIDEDGQELPLSDDRIEQAIIRTGAKLCIFDPIQAYFCGANMNAANTVHHIMKKLGGVAARTNCAILLVGHLSKKSGKATYRSLGSTDIFAAVRSVLTVGRIDVDEEQNNARASAHDTRAIVHNKSNLAPNGPAQAFELDPVGGFTWLGECGIGIEELLGNKKKPENQFAKARRLIEAALAGGSVAAVEIMQMAEEQNISAKTLNRAKSALGVISVKRNGQWFWQMPIEAEYTEVGQEDGQHGHVSTVAALTILQGGVV